MIINPCSITLQQNLLRKTEEREVWYGLLKKDEVIIKINTNKEDREYTRKEFKHTKLAYELCYKELFIISKNPLPKPICFNERIVVLSYIKGESRVWPLLRGNQMNYPEYRAAAKYLAKLHSISVRKTKGLEEDIYGGSSIDCKFKDDYKELYQNNVSKYAEELEYIYDYVPEVLRESKQHSQDLVYSHGDFKPDNFVFEEHSLNYTYTGCNAIEDKVDIGVIDWIDFGLRLRQYDVGSLLFGIQDLNKLNSLLDLYLKEANFEVADKVKFLEEAIALACIVHISAPLKHKEQSSLEKAAAYIEYTQKMLKELDKNGD